MSNLEDQVESFIRHGRVPVKWAEPTRDKPKTQPISTGMSPAKTITDSAASLREYSNLIILVSFRKVLRDRADALERLLPLAELSPEDLRQATKGITTGTFFVDPRRLRLAERLELAADALETFNKSTHEQP